MKVAVCCKLTPDADDIVPSPNGSVNLASANWNVSDFDLNAIQAAADMGADECVAISAGNKTIEKARLTKSLMMHGDLASLLRVVDEDIPSMDTAMLAKVLAAAVLRTDADVVLCGEGSADRNQRMTGSMVAAELGWPCVTFADSIAVEGESIVCNRDLEDGIEEVRVQVPCVISVTSTINTVDVPSMKAVLAAGKKPVERLSLEELGVDVVSRAERVSTSVPDMPGRKRVMLAGTAEEMAAQLVEKLRGDGVL